MGHAKPDVSCRLVVEKWELCKCSFWIKQQKSCSRTCLSSSVTFDIVHPVM